MHSARSLLVLLVFAAGGITVVKADAGQSELTLLQRFAPPLFVPVSPVRPTREGEIGKDSQPDPVDALLSDLQSDDPAQAEREIARLCAHASQDAAEVAELIARALQSSAMRQPVEITPTDTGLFAAFRDIARAHEFSVEREAARARWAGKRVFLLQRLAEVGTAAELSVLLPLADEADAAVGHAAIQAIASIPGAEASEALGRAAQSGYTDRQLAALYRLGERRDNAARETLQALAETGAFSPEAQTAVHASLAAHGVVPDGVDDGVLKSTLLLRVARAREGAGEGKYAAALYDRVAATAAHRHQLCAAILGLSRTDPERAGAVALSTLTVPGVRQTAIQVLTHLPARKDRFLYKAYDVADPATKAALLYVLSARAEEDLTELLGAASLSDDPTLRFVAAELSGGLPPAEDLYWLSENGAPWVREKALRAFLDTAHASVIEGDQIAARERFVAVTQGPFAVEAKVEALRGLVHVAQAGDSAFARQYLDHPDLAKAAARILAAVIPLEMDPGDAREALEDLARQLGGDEVRFAVAMALSDLGEDTEQIVNAAGYVTQWWVLGPVEKRGEEVVSLEETLFPPREVRATKQLMVGDAAHDWEPVSAQGFPAMLDLDAVLAPPATGARACLLARLIYPGWVVAELQIGSSAPYVVWLNGEIVATHDDNRVFKADEDRVSVKFRPGTNRIYVQTLQPGGRWLYGVRIANRRGEALDLNQTRRPDDGLTGVGVQMEGAETVLRDSLP